MIISYINYNMKSRQDTVILINYDTLNDLKSTSDGKFHYFYKIVNNINQKYYYGIHSTDNIFDGYIGSGSLLRQVYKKYGKENCTKYILSFFEDRKSLLDYEKYIVNEELLEDNNCYNMILGGIGTYNTHINVITLDGESKLISKEEYKKNKHLYKTSTAGKVHINNGVKNKMVNKKDLYKYLSDGWIKGQTQLTNLGKIVVNNLEEDRFIYESELEEYLSNGWERGGKSRNKGQNSFAKSLIWINNGTNQKRINESELEEYLSNGWVKGTCQNNTKGYIRITNGQETRNINPSNKEELKYYLSDGWVKGSHSETNKGSVWINNGSETIQIRKNNLEEYLSNGWKKGRLNMVGFTPNINKIAVNKNGEVVMIQKDKLEEYLSNGWKKGNSNRTHKSCLGRVCVTKDDILKKIDQNELEEYLSNGWVKGMGNSIMKGRIRINNGIEEKFVSNEEYENTYKELGYVKGLLKPRKTSKKL